MMTSVDDARAHDARAHDARAHDARANVERENGCAAHTILAIRETYNKLTPSRTKE